MSDLVGNPEDRFGGDAAQIPAYIVLDSGVSNGTLADL